MDQNQPCVNLDGNLRIIYFDLLFSLLQKQVERDGDISRVGSQASGTFIIYKMCFEGRSFTGLENPDVCPQAAHSLID